MNARARRATVNWTSPLDREALALLRDRIWRDVGPGVRPRLVAALALTLVQSATAVAVPYLFKRMIDALSGTMDARALVPIGIFAAFASVHFVNQIGAQLMWAIWEPGHIRLQRRAEMAWFGHIQNLSLRFHLTKRTGGLDQAVTKAVQGVEMILTNLVYTILPILLEVSLIAYVIGDVLDGRYLALLAVTVGLFLAVLFVGAARLHAHLRRGHELHVEARGLATDAVLNYETVKLFGSEEVVERQVLDRQHAALLHMDRFYYGRAAAGAAQAFVIVAGLAAMLWIGMHDVAAGTMTIGSLVMVNTYLLQLVRPLQMFNRAYRAVRQGMTYLAPMQAILAERPEVADAPGARPLAPGPGRVEFRNVSFAYDPRRPILGDVSFTLEPGRTLALVGPTGAGKSTISRLLFRFYDVTSGAILLDGQDVRAVTLASLRRAIAVVPQDTVLFNDTLLANIAVANPDAGREEIEEAARRAQLDGLVATLPDGYLTRVGERGLKLSGGEKQRVAIARALLKRPRLFVFDEATSALDTRTERAILDALRAASAGTSTLMIAHRLSTVAHADTILVLEHGRVAERGTHAELLARGGLYAQMWKRQAEAPSRLRPPA